MPPFPTNEQLSVAAFQYIALYSFPLQRGQGRGRFCVCSCKAYDLFCNIIDVNRIMEVLLAALLNPSPESLRPQNLSVAVHLHGIEASRAGVWAGNAAVQAG